MISRRTVLNGTALGSALAALAPEAALEARGAEPAAQAAAQKELEEIETAIEGVRDEIRRHQTFWELGPVREQIKAFLRVGGKFPDYIEVGVDVWYQIYDWHVRYQQPLNVARNAEGRYTILLASTQVILRTELPLSYIGQGYDNR